MSNYVVLYIAVQLKDVQCNYLLMYLIDTQVVAYIFRITRLGYMASRA